MGAISGLLGTAGGANGTGFSGPGQAQIVNPVTAGQTDQAYAGTQGSLTAQQQLLQALQAQNGIQNQSQVYGQLQGVANGTGPNPAQAMLNQSTGQNVANQAALMAGQRGASANVGLMARQAAQQGAATQQQAVGQGATLQANQSLNALNSAGNMAGTMASNQIGQTNANTSAQQAEQASLLNAQQAYNQAQVSSQSSVNAANAGLANTSMQGQQGTIGGLAQAGAAAAGLAHGGQVKGFADGGDTSAYQGQSKFGAYLSGVSQGASGSGPMATPTFGSDPAAQTLKDGIGAYGSAFQGSSTPITDAGYTMPEIGQGLGPAPAAGSSALGSYDMGSSLGQSSSLPQATSGYGLGTGGMKFSSGGAVPAVVSPGEKYLSPQAVDQVKQGADPLKVGETIPGKPKVGGAKDSYQNDTVPKTLQEGGIVVPRSKTQSKNPEKASVDFVHKVLAKRVGKK